MGDVYDEIACAKYWKLTPNEFWDKTSDDRALMYAFYIADHQRNGVEAFNRKVRGNKS